MRHHRGWRNFARDLLVARNDGLSPRVALFYARARRLASRRRDDFTLRAMTKTRDLSIVLELARGARRVVELGTASATTTIALALDDAERRVWTYDIKPRGIGVDHYARLAPAHVRERISFLRESGAEPTSPPPAVDFVFIDAAHERDETIRMFTVWEQQLSPAGVIAFHDYHASWPGVMAAVEELGLDGEVRGHVFAWRASP